MTRICTDKFNNIYSKIREDLCHLRHPRSINKEHHGKFDY